MFTDQQTRKRRIEIFDTVSKHLLKQNERAGNNGACAYRTVSIVGTPLSCAVGCLIPDDVYHEDMEGHYVGSLLSDFPKLARVFAINLDYRGDVAGEECYKTMRLLRDLQDIHDGQSTCDWEESLIEIGDDIHGEYGLTVD